MKNISAAFVKAQKGFAPALKSSLNPHFKSKYADLAACVEAVIDSLNSNGIALMQKTHMDDTGVTVETMLIHESGETIDGGRLHVPAAKQDPQGYGSALSYARRYSLMATCGIAPEDDDGNSATKAVKDQPGSLENTLKASIEHVKGKKADEVNRTLVMKVRTKIQEHAAADRPMGVAEEWDYARSVGEDFQSGVWAGLTTPEREYIREVNTNRKETT